MAIKSADQQNYINHGTFAGFDACKSPVFVSKEKIYMALPMQLCIEALYKKQLCGDCHNGKECKVNRCEN